MRKKGFIEILPVIISPVTDPLRHATGRAEIEYYGNKFQLTRSMIFHKQMALLSHDKIFSFSPNIRLEPIELADTGRHLVEFTQLDLEVKDGTRGEVMKLAEMLVIYVLTQVKKMCENELNLFNRDFHVPEIPFKRIPYKDAYNRYGTNFEVVLSQQYREPFWVVDIPIGAREFYDKEDPKRPGILLDMDLVYPEGHGEALSGGEREHTYDRLVQRIEKQGLNPSDFEWYLEIAKQGLPKSAGFGIEIERFTKFVCGLRRIEEVSLFPKTPGGVSL